MTPLRRRMIEDMRIRNYSPHTINGYVRQVARLARYFGRSPDQIATDEVRAFLVHLRQEVGASVAVMQNVVAGLRFFYRVTLGRDLSIDEIPTPKREKKLPVVLSPEEARSVVGALANLKHRAILSACYDAGLRVSEVTRLRRRDRTRKPAVDLESNGRRFRGHRSMGC
jgi:site-specific recombinase XerD